MVGSQHERHYGLKLAMVIVLSTWFGLIVSALTLRVLMRHAPPSEDDPEPPGEFTETSVAAADYGGHQRFIRE